MNPYPVPHELDCNCSDCRATDRQLDRNLAEWRADIDRNRAAKATRRDRGWLAPLPRDATDERTGPDGYPHTPESSTARTDPRKGRD